MVIKWLDKLNAAIADVNNSLGHGNVSFSVLFQAGKRLTALLRSPIKCPID
jgi:hypothetical protein